MKLPSVQTILKQANGQTLILYKGDKISHEITISCDSRRCASRNGQDKPQEVTVVDNELPPAGDQWLSVILPERSPSYGPLPKNFCSPTCLKDFLVYDYMAPGPRVQTTDIGSVPLAEPETVELPAIAQADGSGE